MEDRELLAAWAAGDRDAGARLVKRHYESIARFFRNKVDGPAQDDLVQQTFLTCSEIAERFRGGSSVRTFLFGIAHNVLRAHLRKIGRQRKRMSEREFDLDQMSVSQLGQSPVSVVSGKQEQRLLLEGLRMLSLNQQVALELHYWEHLTAEQIASITGAPLGTTKTRLRDGKLRLARILAELADSEALLRSTLDNLEDWARRMRGHLGRADDT